MKSLLNISNLSVSLNNKNIIDKFNLNIMPGEVHVVMGPNGVGKSTLSRVLAGDFISYNISGNIMFDGYDLFSLSQNEIALRGMFLSFQNPIDIPGVSNIHFFKSFLNCKRKYYNMPPIEHSDFLSDVNFYMNALGMKNELLYRSVNFDFSGGEKKKNEILQMLLLKPIFSILDEIDSGVDIDSLKLVFNCINSFKNKTNAFLIITHYCRIIDYIPIDFVHVINNGTIVKTGDSSLLYDIDKYGYTPYN